MKTYTLYANQMARIINDSVDVTSSIYSVDRYDECGIGFDLLPEGLINSTIKNITIAVYLDCSTLQPDIYNQYGVWKANRFKTKFTEEETIQKGSFPNDIALIYDAYKPLTSESKYYSFEVSGDYFEYISNGMLLVVNKAIYDSPGYINIYTKHSEFPPYLLLSYEEGQPVTKSFGPIGYQDRTKPIIFSWDIVYSNFPIESIDQESATLYWRDGTEGEIHSISLTGNEKKYTMPGSTLPVSQNIQWRVQATIANGQTTQNINWQSIQTTDALPITMAISPSGTYVDGTKEVLFTWNHNTDTGTAQTAYDLQIKTSVGDWTTIQSGTTQDEYCNLPANTLPSGTLQWRVRTYNADGTAGSWSNELTIVVIAAPAAPVAQIDVISPRPKISWTSQDQQAYQVQMGTYDSGLQFGTAKSFKCPVYLPNGSTRMRVRVLNEYNLWSDWTEIIATITNVPGTAPVLAIEAGYDAQLSWAENESAGEYWVYRDGKCIAKTYGNTYIDRLSIGKHTYYIKETYSENDNYTDSNTVTVTLKTEYPIICDLENSGWIKLKLSINSVPSVQISMQQDIALVQYTGSEYPTPEVSDYKQRTYSISTAYMDIASCVQFESLLGKVVCIKDQYDNLIIGIMSSYAKTSTTFYTTYTATVSEIDEGEYLENN